MLKVWLKPCVACFFNFLVGAPIAVTKTEDPTQEQINKLHDEYITALVQLFDKYKEKYCSNPELTLQII